MRKGNLSCVSESSGTSVGFSALNLWRKTMGNRNRARLRIAMLVCVCGLLQSLTAQTFQRINQPFTCPNSENFDSIAAGAYSTLNTAVGTFQPLPPITGVMLVFASPPPAHTPPNYLRGRSQDIEWLLPQPACRVGGYFRAVSIPPGGPPPADLDAGQILRRAEPLLRVGLCFYNHHLAVGGVAVPDACLPHRDYRSGQHDPWLCWHRQFAVLSLSDKYKLRCRVPSLRSLRADRYLHSGSVCPRKL